MRAFALLPAFIALVSAAATPFTPATCLTELPCDGSFFDNGLGASLAIDVERRMTNGQRLARGLPPKTPARHWNAAYRRDPGPSNTPTDPTPESSSAPPEPSTPASSAPPEPSASAPPVPPEFTTYRGYIKVDRTDVVGELGYLSRHPFSGAQHRYEDISKAMIINIDVPKGATTVSQIEIRTENSDIQTTFPRLSLVQGRDNTDSDLRAGSYQYIYFAGSDSTSPGAPPQNAANSYSEATGTTRTAESAVWTFDPITNIITPTWINTDGSEAITKIFSQSTALYAGGDPGAFVARYPSPIFQIRLSFVPL